MAENEEKAKALGTVSVVSGLGAAAGCGVAAAAGITLAVPAAIGGAIALIGYVVAKAVKKD